MSPLSQDMPAETFRRLMSRVGFASTGQLAEFFGVSKATAGKWQSEGPSPPVVLLLQVMNARGWRPEDKERIIDAEPHGEEMLREMAEEFFEGEGAHETGALSRWAPLDAEDTLDYLMRFAKFVLAHPKAFR